MGDRRNLHADLVVARRHTENLILEHLRAFQDLTGFCPSGIELVTTPAMGGVGHVAGVRLRIEL